jgi:hypothetical protein
MGDDGQNLVIEVLFVKQRGVQLTANSMARRSTGLPPAALRVLEERSVHYTGHLHLRIAGRFWSTG